MIEYEKIMEYEKKKYEMIEFENMIKYENNKYEMMEYEEIREYEKKKYEMMEYEDIIEHKKMMEHGNIMKCEEKKIEMIKIEMMIEDEKNKCKTIKYEKNEVFKDKNKFTQEINIDSIQKTSIFFEIVSLIDCEGFWELSALLTTLNFSHEKSQEIASIYPDHRILATIFAVRYLNKHFINKKNEWVLIERKALRWLKKLGIEIDEICERINNYLD
ncbi:hypothetical protein SteCoe_18700 [Stentor coeruleus]|uniref:Uncharacterized protein n=1 Tax=Stentor coeruleus TaxID=5963 RepID=A0A1R2BVU3_9CILI|nr:hypothetical protein SteCoe_18700 [Stentor coeruleus]